MKRVIIRNICFLIVALFLFSLVVEYSSITFFKEAEKEEEIPVVVPKETSVSLIMVGDSLIHGAVYEDAKSNGIYDFRPMLSELKPIVSEYDLAFYNQETILGGTGLGLSSYPRFNSPYEVGDAFLDSGFNIVALANNHTLDKGEKGIINSCNYWKDKEALVAGSYSSLEDRNSVVVKEKNGIKYAMLSYTTWTNGLKVPSGKNYLLTVSLS